MMLITKQTLLPLETVIQIANKHATEALLYGASRPYIEHFVIAIVEALEAAQFENHPPLPSCPRCGTHGPHTCKTKPETNEDPP
jgi:hypothetical protein